MRWLPLAVQAAVAALLLASIVRSFLGPPPPRARLTAALVLLGAAGAVLSAGAAALLQGASAAGTALAVLGVELACASAWLGRGPLGPGRGPDDPRDDDPDDPAPAGWDWGAFDRARATWSQPQRRPSGVR